MAWKIKYRGIGFLFSLLLLSCSSVGIKENSEEQKQFSDKINNNASECLYNKQIDTLDGYIGIISLNDKYKANDTIVLYDEIDTTSKIYFFLDSLMFQEYEKYKYIGKCYKIEDNFLYVELNADKKYKIRCNEKRISFHEWKTHILKDVACIEFNNKTNPIRTEPTDESDIININSETIDCFQPLEIKDEWLKIRWDERMQVIEKEWIITKNGWIKWKQENKILIDLYYFM